jgi:hypothetical protein
MSGIKNFYDMMKHEQTNNSLCITIVEPLLSESEATKKDGEIIIFLSIDLTREGVNFFKKCRSTARTSGHTQVENVPKYKILQK